MVVDNFFYIHIYTFIERLFMTVFGISFNLIGISISLYLKVEIKCECDELIQERF